MTKSISSELVPTSECNFCHKEGEVVALTLRTLNPLHGVSYTDVNSFCRKCAAEARRALSIII